MGLMTSLFGPAEPEKFSKIVTHALRRAGYGHQLDFDAETFSLNVTGGETNEVVFLGNVYSNYCAAPRRDRDAVVRQFALSIRERELEAMPESFDAAKKMLLPSVRSLAYFSCSNQQIRLQLSEGAKAEAEEKRDFVPGGRLTANIGVTIVLDYPHTSRLLNPSILDEWGVAFDDALEVAKVNLRKVSRERFEQIAPGVFASPWQDSYDASRLLTPEVFTSLEVSGDPVALAPHRDLVLITGSEDTEGLRTVAALAVNQVQSPYPVSLRPLVLRGFEWAEFTEFPDPATANAFKRLALQQLAGDYEDQTNLLKTAHERAGDDLWVASFFATEHSETGVLSSFCSWGDIPVQLIPEVERVAFASVGENGEARSLGMVPWARVREVMGGVMSIVEDLHPPRWRVEGFPSEDELARMQPEP